MNNVNKTLYIPLYGKAYVSSRKILLEDPKAEAIWQAEGFPLRGKAKSKWLAYYMGMRSAVFDQWLQEAIGADPQAVILHIGCGLDSRPERVAHPGHLWLDVDFPEVIAQRRKFFPETEQQKMIGTDIRDEAWLEQIPAGSSLVIVMEGISMYLTMPELKAVLSRWKQRFPQLRLLLDSYTEFAARATKYKNPINTVGVSQVYGFDDPQVLTEDTGLTFVQEHNMTPERLICQLKGMEQSIFRRVFAGKMAGMLYRLYEYE